MVEVNNTPNILKLKDLNYQKYSIKGVFLIPYFTSMFIIGMPMVYLEFIVGKEFKHHYNAISKINVLSRII